MLLPHLHGQESILHIYSKSQIDHLKVEIVLQFLAAHFAASPVKTSYLLIDPNFLEVSSACTLKQEQLINIKYHIALLLSIVLHERTEIVEPVAGHIQQQVTEFTLPLIAV